jgi:hypothetical protein
MRVSGQRAAPRQVGTAWKRESFSHGVAAGKGAVRVVVRGIKVCGDCSEKL